MADLTTSEDIVFIVIPGLVSGPNVWWIASLIGVIGGGLWGYLYRRKWLRDQRKGRFPPKR